MISGRNESFGGSRNDLSLLDKIGMLSWGLILLIVAIAAVGVGLLFSAGYTIAGGWEPYAAKQGVRFGILFFVMLAIAVVDLRMWLRLAYPIYAATLLLLVGVEVMGQIGMGAQRWIAVGPIVLQPSELMKIALTLALARYYHTLAPEQVTRLYTLIIPLVLIVMPVVLVLLQPNLGTATLLVLASGMMLWTAGVAFWLFAAAGLAVLTAIPIAWEFLHDYQKQRVLTFLNPESDPLDTGYNIMQSKIAFGSGGMFGKGFLQGTQSQLAFLPEKHTDFIFVVLAEEFGLVGALTLLALYALVIAYGFYIAFTTRSQFGRLVAIGVTSTLFLYVFVNIAMITGLIPVVGIPLPLVSNGGTAMMTLLIGCGLLLCVAVHRDVRLSKSGLTDF